VALISVGGSFNPRTIVRLEQLSNLKNFIRILTSDLSACSMVFQPCVLPLKGGDMRNVEIPVVSGVSPQFWVADGMHF
jgi:hypothetical protein